MGRPAELELIDRERRMVERRIKAAKFPAVKSLDSFDFKAMPSLNKIIAGTETIWQEISPLYPVMRQPRNLWAKF